MTRLICAALLLSPVLCAADACSMIPLPQIAGMLGITKNTGVETMKLPAKATEGKACSYVGKDNSATFIWIKFSTPAAAREYLKSIRDALEKQSVKTTAEKYSGEDGFSFSSGAIAVKKNVWLRANVNSTVGKILAPDLTRQLMLDALRAN